MDLDVLQALQRAVTWRLLSDTGLDNSWQMCILHYVVAVIE